jgi:hypothetical protein
MDAATVVKPVRKLVLPPPPAPRQKQQPQPAAAPSAAKKPPQPAHVQAQGQSWTAVRSQGSRAVGGSAGAARPAGGYSKTGSFSASSGSGGGGYIHIPNLPVWLQVPRQLTGGSCACIQPYCTAAAHQRVKSSFLPVAPLPIQPHCRCACGRLCCCPQMCPDLQGDGDCFRYRCEFCHSRVRTHHTDSCITSLCAPSQLTAASASCAPAELMQLHRLSGGVA